MTFGQWRNVGRMIDNRETSQGAGRKWAKRISNSLPLPLDDGYSMTFSVLPLVLFAGAFFPKVTLAFALPT